MHKTEEVKHLERAVDAIKRGLLPQKSREPDSESDEEMDREDSEPEKEK